MCTRQAGSWQDGAMEVKCIMYCLEGQFGVVEWKDKRIWFHNINKHSKCFNEFYEHNKIFQNVQGLHIHRQMVGSSGSRECITVGLDIEYVVVAWSVDEADLGWLWVVWKVMVIDRQLWVVVRSHSGTAVDVFDTDWNISWCRQRSNVDVVALSSHRLHLLRQ